MTNIIVLKQLTSRLWKVKFFIKIKVYYLLRLLFGFFGYSYINAQYGSGADNNVEILTLEDIRDIAGVTMEAILRKDGVYGYGLVKRLKLNEQSKPYSKKGDLFPAHYWQFGKFMMFSKQSK